MKRRNNIGSRHRRRIWEAQREARWRARRGGWRSCVEEGRGEAKQRLRRSYLGSNMRMRVKRGHVGLQ